MTTSIDEHASRIATDGYTILEGVLAPDLVDTLADDLMRLEHAFGVEPAGNSFEGAQTIRIYNLLAFGALYEQVPVHPEVLPVLLRGFPYDHFGERSEGEPAVD